MPEGFMLEVIPIGTHFVNGPCYLITLTSTYNGRQWTSGDVLNTKNFGYISAIRDHLKFSHWRHMQGQQWENMEEWTKMLETFKGMPSA